MNLTLVLGGLLAASITSSFLIAISYSADLKIANLEKEAISVQLVNLKEDAAFLKQSIEVRDNTYFVQQTALAQVDRVIEKQQTTIYKYIPTPEEAESDEFKCLKLMPPASLLEQLYSED